MASAIDCVKLRFQKAHGAASAGKQIIDDSVELNVEIGVDLPIAREDPAAAGRNGIIFKNVHVPQHGKEELICGRAASSVLRCSDGSQPGCWRHRRRA